MIRFDRVSKRYPNGRDALRENGEREQRRNCAERSVGAHQRLSFCKTMRCESAARMDVMKSRNAG